MSEINDIKNEENVISSTSQYYEKVAMMFYYDCDNEFMSLLEKLEKEITDYDITVNDIVRVLTKYIHIIKRENISMNAQIISIKQLRVWICKNIIRSLNSRLIDINTTERTCDYLNDEYGYILTVFFKIYEQMKYVDYRMDEFTSALCAFLTIDNLLQQQYDSVYNLTELLLADKSVVNYENYESLLNCEG